jgi:hydrogenase nickel incorporation protein HypB
VVSLVSSPGSGKTAFLEEVLGRLRDEYRIAALVGDLATDNDARRLARSRVPVKQITTGTVCHLEAAMVESALEDWDLEELDFLFIENVGNLVCPSTFDLGEDHRLVLFSVTEGEDKPLKYPTIFQTADVALITKIDLAEAVSFDAAAAHRSIQSVRPGMEVFEVSTKTGEGLTSWLDSLSGNHQTGPLTPRDSSSGHLQPADGRPTGREGAGLDPHPLEHRNVEIRERIVVVRVKREVLTVAEASSSEEDREVDVAVTVGAPHAGPVENLGPVEEGFGTLVRLGQGGEEAVQRIELALLVALQLGDDLGTVAVMSDIVNHRRVDE